MSFGNELECIRRLQRLLLILLLRKVSKSSIQIPPEMNEMYLRSALREEKITTGLLKTLTYEPHGNLIMVNVFMYSYRLINGRLALIFPYHYSSRTIC